MTRQKVRMKTDCCSAITEFRFSAISGQGASGEGRTGGGRPTGRFYKRQRHLDRARDFFFFCCTAVHLRRYSSAGWNSVVILSLSRPLFYLALWRIDTDVESVINSGDSISVTQKKQLLWGKLVVQSMRKEVHRGTCF